MVDRIDIHIDVPAVPFNELQSEKFGSSSETMRDDILKARDRQQKRFANENVLTNAGMGSRQTRKYCKLDEQGKAMIKQAVYELGISARAHDKILKISRTIADLEDSDNIQAHHIAEAIQYRRLDREF